jgi:predicted outer membrane repeat protein
MSFSDNATNFSAKTLVFIDANLEGYQYLASGVLDQVEVRILDPEQNGILAVTTELQKFAAFSGAIDAVHIFSHGSPGEVQLGSSILNSQTLEQYKNCLQQWQSLLSDDADLLIYGCNVASGDGVDFVQQLSELTGANVAASVDLTGNSAKGGNWELEVKMGEIKATAVLKPEVMASYEGVLAIRTVTSAADDNNPGSLRNAIAAANSGDTIVFDSSLAGQTITLTQGEIRINPGKNITIDGANAANLTISGNNASRIFLIDANVATSTNATIKNLKLVNGYVNPNAGAAPMNDSTKGRGGAIAGADEATLTVENVEFNNNVADLGGGAIYMAWNSNLSVNNSKFNANKAIAGNDERGAGAIAFLSPGNFTVRNSDFTNNRGIVGGAINSLNGKLTVENSRFINNDTESAFFDNNDPIDPFLRGYGGAIYTDRASSTGEESRGIGGTIRITGSVFDKNRSKAGGGATYLFTAPADQVIIEDTTYTNNKAFALPGGEGGNGGALYQLSDSQNGGLTIRNTTFANNTAMSQGGGAWIFNRPATITNSTFFGNRAESSVPPDTTTGNGGAIAFYSPADIVNTTIANNYAGWVAGAVLASTNQAVTVKNTIFADNTAANPFQIKQETSRELTDLGGNIQSRPAGDNNATASITIADPKLGTLQEINGKLVLPLLPGSPAIDFGTGAGAPNTDQRGVTRPIDGDGNGSAIVDSGSYEFNGNVATLAPEIEVKNGTTSILDGTTTAIDFGSTTVGSAVTKTFTINNTGTSSLSLSTPTLPTGFTVLGIFPSSIAPGSTADFQLQLNATATGNPLGTISFANNDSDENPFDFAIAGTVNPVANLIPTITNVTSTAPNGKYTVGQVIPINVTFSENVFVNGTPQLVLETGVLDAVVNLSSGSGTNTLTFNYKVGVKDTTPDLDYLSRGALKLNNGAIEDADGNNAVLTLPTPGTPGSLSANKAIEIPAFKIIAGTNRRDNLTGTALSDRLIGEQSNDTLTGGGGADEFVYNRIQDRFDTITDFQVGIDKIVMTNLLASFNYSGSNPIADGIVSFSSQGSNTILLLDPDGTDGSALASSYITFINVSVADLNNPNNFVFS